MAYGRESHDKRAMVPTTLATPVRPAYWPSLPHLAAVPDSRAPDLGTDPAS